MGVCRFYFKPPVVNASNTAKVSFNKKGKFTLPFIFFKANSVSFFVIPKGDICIKKEEDSEPN